MRPASLVLRFVLELTALVLLAAWGFTLEAGWPVRIAAGLAAPAIAAGVWGRLIAPKASHRLRDPAKLLLELVIFGAAAATLGSSWWIFAGVVVVSEVLTFALGQRAS